MISNWSLKIPLQYPMLGLEEILNSNYLMHNRTEFIKDDPISIPHQFTKKEDIEIMAFFIAIMAWGQRISILRSGHRLINIFDHSPHQFILQHQDSDLKKCLGFVHRTFNNTDLLSFIAFLKEIYSQKGGLETAFSKHLNNKEKNVEASLNGFRKSYELSSAFIRRTSKHIAYPMGGSACKRLNMFLRWMVRNDSHGVDFGLWKSISPSQLICPLDVHVIRQAKKLGLIHSEKSNWHNAVELTEQLKRFDKSDPVKYDFALFGMGIKEKLA